MLLEPEVSVEIHLVARDAVRPAVPGCCDMLYVDVCGDGQVTELLLRVRGVVAQEVIAHALRDGGEPMEFVVERDGTRRYEDRSGRDLAGVPVIEVVVTTHDEASALVDASYGACTMRLAPPPVGSALGGSARPATARECVELALRWCFGLGRMGCCDPIETISQAAHVSTEAWTVEEPVTFDASADAPTGYEGTTQVWLGRLPHEEHADEVGRLFGVTSSDAWAARGPQRRNQVLVAAFTKFEGEAPTRPARTVDHSHLLDEA